MVGPLCALMWQQFSILFALLISINRGQLSIYDANFSLAVTSPPFSIYLLFSALEDQFIAPSEIFERCGKWRRWLRYLAFLHSGLWFIVITTQTLSETAFTDSALCGLEEFGSWTKMIAWRAIQLVFPFTSYFFFGDSIGLFTLVQWGLFVIYLFRHHHVILEEHRERWARRPHDGPTFKAIAYFIGLLGQHVYVRLFA